MCEVLFACFVFKVLLWFFLICFWRAKSLELSCENALLCWCLIVYALKFSLKIIFCSSWNYWPVVFCLGCRSWYSSCNHFPFLHYWVLIFSRIWWHLKIGFIFIPLGCLFYEIVFHFRDPWVLFIANSNDIKSLVEKCTHLFCQLIHFSVTWFAGFLLHCSNFYTATRNNTQYLVICVSGTRTSCDWIFCLKILQSEINLVKLVPICCLGRFTSKGVVTGRRNLFLAVVPLAASSFWSTQLGLFFISHSLMHSSFPSLS